MLSLALSAFLAATISALPAANAFAGQVLELPRTAVPEQRHEAPVEATSMAASEAKALPPLPSGLGSLNDYESQGEGESAQSVGLASAPPNTTIDPNGGRDVLVKNVILGALMIGMFALEVHAAHQHRHR